MNALLDTSSGLAYALDEVPLAEQLTPLECATWLMKIVGGKTHLGAFVRDSYGLSSSVNKSILDALVESHIDVAVDPYFRIRHLHTFYHMVSGNLGRLEPKGTRALLYLARTGQYKIYWIEMRIGGKNEPTTAHLLDAEGLAELIGRRNPEKVSLEVIASLRSLIQGDRENLTSQLGGLATTDSGLAADVARFIKLDERRKQVARS